MSPVVAGLIVLGALALPARTRADIYEFRDADGVLHFTNAPTTPSRLAVREPRLPPAPPILVLRPPGGSRGDRTPYDVLIREVAARYGVEYALVKAIIKAESAFDCRAVSPAGAAGLMQLMPATAAHQRVRNVFLPRDNIEGGVRHLRMLLDRYDGNVLLAVAAYNAGTERVEEAGGVPPIAETRAYVSRVLRHLLAYRREGDRVLASGR
jgi:soluble lytic murein transglycosylase-like protein